MRFPLVQGEVKVAVQCSKGLRQYHSDNSNSSFRLVIQIRREPALDGAQIHLLAAGIVFDLIFPNLAD
jgi:hypothetical protein